MSKELFYSLLVLGIVLTSGAQAAIDEGLVGWWMFDEGAGTTVADSSGAGHDGVFVDGTPEWVAGMYGKALRFDGDNKVEIPDHEDFHMVEAVSVALWAQPESNQPDYAKFFCKQKSGEYPYALQFSSSLSIRATINASGRYDTSTIPNFPGEWAHLCFTYDGSVLILYKDGEEAVRINASGDLQQNDLSLSIGGRLGSGQNFIGIIDDVRLFNRALTAEEIQQVMVDVPPPTVTDPSPDDGATEVPRDVVLSWVPVDAATQHDIYFGTDAQAVAGADTSDTTGIYRGRQIAGSHSPAEALVFGETYYWRVDEVGAPPDNTVLRGNLWSFTVELFVYPVTDVVATASSSESGKEAANTVNGSGLDESGLLHGNESVGNMWLSARDANQPTWIEFEFDRVHKLNEMWVWNSNDSLEQAIGLGFKDVVIEYSTDGADFTTLGATHEFAQAPGAAGYAHDTTIDMAGVGAKYVRLTANSNWGDILEQYGLSEVRFFSIPVGAREPSPASGATDVPLDPVLGWTAGREAAGHDVYFSDDLQAVTDGTAPVTAVTEGGYGSLSLNVGTTYYWRIDEVNDAETPSTWQGDIWDFTTVESLVVDDFESYDSADNQIWYAWKDGLGYGTPDTPPYFAGNGTGAAVGDESTGSFTEETIVHGGNQSMPLAYNNNKQGYLNYSEAAMTLNSQRDWTARGVKELSLWFRGFPGSVGSFVEGPVGTYTMTAAGTDIWDAHDEFHFAYKQLSGVGSITAKVDSVENTDPWAKAGVMIRETLDPGSKFAAVYITPTNADGTPTQGCRFQGRTDTDGSATSDTSVATDGQKAVTAPYWVKLERDFAGNLRGYYSSDGSTWVPLVWRPSISMGSNVYIGLAVTSHNVALTCEATFSGVQTTGTVTGQWQSQDIGISSNSAESMYVAVSNSAGAPAIVNYDEPAATQIDAWTQWVIPTQVFADQGVNLADVDNILIGLGDRNNPQAGGSGTIYIDDIRLYGLRPVEQ
ncbi:MAG TPA: LamG-like jellyroll fold domain-containing protein [Sedimentisphaerales bacterium]|nr:LamG-like jellyroll fold domain-containing protein [Sedimentisphaerales bacterium]